MRAAIIAIALIAAPAIATAEVNTDRDCPPGEDCTEYRFDDEDITAPIRSGGMETVDLVGRGRRVSLLNVRQHFIPELVKSVENL